MLSLLLISCVILCIPGMASPALGDAECFRASLVSSISIWNGGNPLDYSFPLLSLQLLFIASISWILYFLLRPLKQPRIVSEILSGILLGRSGLCRSSRFRDLIFPSKGKPVLHMIATFGLIFVTFNIGVKMDAGLIRRTGAKSVTIGLLGMFIPFFGVLSLGFIGFHQHPVMASNYTLLFILSTSLSISSFAILVPILSELNLLNSELGRTATSASFTNDFIGWSLALSFVVLWAGKASAIHSLYALFAMAAFLAFIFFVVRPVARRAIAHTLPGKSVKEEYIFIFFIFLLIASFVGDAIGVDAAHGALLLGLAIPDGPPLGAILSKRTEAVVSGLLSPFYYALVGLEADVASVVEWHGFAILLLASVVGKLVGIILASLYFRMPIRDALSLSLFMSSKGLIDVITYYLLRSRNAIDEQTYTILLLSAVVITAIVVPIATMLYEPSRRYAVYKRRTVQHHRPGTELTVVACVHDESRLPAIISFLEAAHGAAASSVPVAIYTLHLVELIGRAAPLFIDQQQAAKYGVQDSERINKAFLGFEQMHQGKVAVYPFTTVSPYGSMHDEICRLAVEKRAALVLLPFHKTPAIRGGWEQSNNGLRAVNMRVLENAPCSVGVLVDGSNKAVCNLSGFSHDVAVLFFGGADDREALAVAGMMAAHSGVRMTVLRLLPSRSIRDDEVERRLDVRAVEEFRAGNKWNKRVVYLEKLVGDMEEVMLAIGETERRGFDLVMVGMRHVSNSVVSELSEWAECPELGVIGDMLASSEFEQGMSVLVVKQQAEVVGFQQQHHNNAAFAAEEELPAVVEAVSLGALLDR